MSSGEFNGHIDGLQGSFIVGWAVSSHKRMSEIVVQDEAAAVLAKGVASTRRADLDDLPGGGRALAFRIALDDLDGRSALHVFADGVELVNSPLRIGPGIFDGSFTLKRGMIEGWVSERVTQYAAPEIVIHDQDGNVVLACGSFLEDGLPPAKFFGELRSHCFGTGELLLSARANGVWFADLACQPMLLNGTIEIVTSERCAGWLMSMSAPARSFEIEVYRNGKFVVSSMCDRARSDVQDAFPGCSLKTGFDFDLPAMRDDEAGFTSLSFRLPGSAAELFNGPFVLGGRGDMVLAARSVSRLALEPSSKLSTGEKAVLQSAMSDFIAKARAHDRLLFGRQASAAGSSAAAPSLTVIIPIYRGIEITRECIDSVLATRSAHHRVVLIDDHSPEIGMAEMLLDYIAQPNLHVLTNLSNIGFVRSVNRALSFCKGGDVVLLNSDTRLFHGGLEELCHVATKFPDVGTVTALSNNATIFSYPHATLKGDSLDDISWEELAAIALKRNHGVAIGSPTGHGFCLFIKGDVLRRVGNLDEVFGRGYGEENDLCARAADLGYRNVAAAGVLVQHRESLSFSGDKAALLAANLATLQSRYPEYTPIIMEAERHDIFRSARWSLDGARLMRASQAGATFALVMRNTLTGGTSQAIADIEETVGYGATRVLVLSCRPDGFMELKAESPKLCAVFSPNECDNLFSVLSTAHIRLIVVHQLLGFSTQFVSRLQSWIAGRRSIFYAHDYYPICPRVTMINAVNQFCNVAPADVCARCVAVGGAHQSSRMEDLAPGQHRKTFAHLLAAFEHVVTPSGAAAGYLRSILPDVNVEVIAHPSPVLFYPAEARQFDGDEVVLLGAIGAHKGSGKLLEMAQIARLLRPALRFRVIGYTDRDAELRSVGNVLISGPYVPDELAELVKNSTGRFALFLSEWPETYSYTLSEAARLGFIPLVPDIGALAERVTVSGFGVVFPFPIVSAQVLELISELSSSFKSEGATPGSLAPQPGSIERTKALLGLGGKGRAKAKSR